MSRRITVDRADDIMAQIQSGRGTAGKIVDLPELRNRGGVFRDREHAGAVLAHDRVHDLAHLREGALDGRIAHLVGEQLKQLPRPALCAGPQ